MSNKNLLCVAIMVKNEEDRIVRTLSNIIKRVCHVVILDTGSTDKTVEVIQKYCKKKKKPLKLKKTTFVDFSYSRNILLKMCYGLSEFVILLDANDEVRNAITLTKFLRGVRDNKKDCVFGCKFIWENDMGIEGNNRTYYKIGVIRNNKSDIYYEFPVHEYITSSSHGEYYSNNSLQKTNFYIYQDRSKDKSSMPRIKRDIDTLNKYIEDNGNNIRAFRFLCQSYNIMKDYENLYKTSTKMLQIIEEKDKNLNTKFNNNYYGCLMYIGNSMHNLELKNYHGSYLKAYSHSKIIFDNAEPLYELASFKAKDGEYYTAYIYIKKCIKIERPVDIFDTEVNYQIYDKHRWSLLLTIAEKLDKMDDYKIACKKLYGRDDLIPLNKSNTDINTLSRKQQDIINRMFRKQKQKQKPKEELMKQTKGSKLYLLVSYRDREKQLIQYVPYMKRYLNSLQIDHEIIIIEQDDYSLFNKGMLYNFAVKYINQLENSDINNAKTFLCFHDIDILPTKGTNYYKPDENTFDHLYGYKFSLGGVFLCNFEDYIKINGFSNMYRGWGFEDNDIQRRVKSKNMEIDRSFFNIRYDKYCFRELDAPSSFAKMENKDAKDNRKLFEENNDPTLDGINKFDNFEEYINVQTKIIKDSNNDYEFIMIKCKVTEFYNNMIL